MAVGTTAQRALADAGINPQNLNRAIEEVRKGRKADSASSEDSMEALKNMPAT